GRKAGWWQTKKKRENRRSRQTNPRSRPSNLPRAKRSVRRKARWGGVRLRDLLTYWLTELRLRRTEWLPLWLRSLPEGLSALARFRTQRHRPPEGSCNLRT